MGKLMKYVMTSGKFNLAAASIVLFIILWRIFVCMGVVYLIVVHGWSMWFLLTLLLLF